MSEYEWLERFEYGKEYETVLPLDFVWDCLKIEYAAYVMDPDYIPERSMRIRNALNSVFVPRNLNR